MPSISADWLLSIRFVRNLCFWLVELMVRRRIPFGNLSLNRGAGCDLNISYSDQLVLSTALNTAGNNANHLNNAAFNVYIKMIYIRFIVMLRYSWFVYINYLLAPLLTRYLNLRECMCCRWLYFSFRWHRYVFFKIVRFMTLAFMYVGLFRLSLAAIFWLGL